MRNIVRKSPARGRHRRPAGNERPARNGRPARHSHRRSKIYWLNAVALCLMAAGIVMAFAGRDALRWAPPPIPSTWTAANGVNGVNGAQSSTSAATHASLRPEYLIARPMAGLVPAAVTNS
jgi:hypothetical protein